ncbi:tetratricopeptide repeat protein, partial [Clostridium perfringens]
LIVWSRLSDPHRKGDAAFLAKNYSDAYELWKPLADSGSARAQYDLGLLYDHGFGVPNDHAKAVEWYRKSAAQGYAQAELNLGVMY